MKNIRKIFWILIILLINESFIYSDIIFSSRSEYYYSQLYLCDDNGENIRLITDPKLDMACINPDYSKKLNKIVFRTYSPGIGYKIMMNNPWNGT